MKRSRVDMLHGRLLPNIISYTIPIILTGLLQLAFNAADLVIVGRYCGSNTVAAVGATGAVTHLVVNLFVGLSVGGGVTVAHSIGSKDDEAVHRTVHTAVPTALIGGAVLMVYGISSAAFMLRLMGTPDDIIGLSTLYMQIIFCGIPFQLLYNFCAAILRAAGDTKGPLRYLSIAGVINVCLNVIFVTVFDLSVAGVAIATATSHVVSSMLVVRALMRRTDACRLIWKKMHIYKKQFLTIVRLGLPAGIQGSMFSISNALIQSSVNSFGDIFMRGNAAAGNLEGFVHVCLNGFHQTALNFTGQNIGAGQYQRVKKIMGICLGCVCVVGMVMGGAMYLFAEQLLSIYITDSAEAIGYGVLRITFICLPYFIFGMSDVFTGLLRGLGSSMVSMMISIMGICVLRVAWITTAFASNPTPQVLYFSYPLSWVITLLAQMTAFFFVYRRKMAKQLRTC